MKKRSTNNFIEFSRLLQLPVVMILCLLISGSSRAQNITNTLGTSGTFIIKNGPSNYFTLDQATGQVNILNTLRLENTTSSSTGIIYKGASSFLHNYGSNNLFLGINSGNFTLTGNNNTAAGNFSLFTNSTGYENSAFGLNALRNNTTGDENSVFGFKSLYFNTNGNFNSAFGNSSLNSNTFGNYNSAFGYYSLQSNTTGTNNTAIGTSSGSSITTGTNNTTLGSNAQVPSGTANNQVRIGNTSVTYAGVQVAWTITSDRRWKSNILNSDLGLKFISKLNPVSYTRKNDEYGKTEYGFIAQELEEVLKKQGIDNSGMITIDDEGKYELRYNDLFAPMVKAIQELNSKCDNLQNENTALNKQLEEMHKQKENMAEIQKTMAELKSRIMLIEQTEVKSLNGLGNENN